MHKALWLLVLLFPLQGCSLETYRYTDLEVKALGWVFAPDVVEYVTTHTYVDEFPPYFKSISYFKQRQGIFVNRQKAAKYRYALVAVHEAVHYVQWLRGEKLYYYAPGKAYDVNLDAVHGSQEQQAEAARILAIAHLSNIYQPIQANDELIYQMNADDKSRLWQQLADIGIPRPADWLSVR